IVRTFRHFLLPVLRPFTYIIGKLNTYYTFRAVFCQGNTNAPQEKKPKKREKSDGLRNFAERSASETDCPALLPPRGKILAPYPAENGCFLV
ncbi:MAG: hypothetical protein ACI4RO_03440, partial [Candidatus Scatosoma sp.]